MTVATMGAHACDYKCCDYCNEYYPQDTFDTHKEYCYHNPFRRYENPYSQNPKEREGMVAGEVEAGREASNEVISRQEEIVTLPDGNQILRIITRRPHGFNVEERRVRRAQPQPGTSGGPQVIHNPLPAFHQNSRTTPTRSQPEPQPQPNPQQQHQRRSSEEERRPRQASGGMQLTLPNPLAGMFGPQEFSMEIANPFESFNSYMPERDLRDNFGPFFMFGQNPLDPMMRNRAYNQSFDPFDNLLRDHVNFVRVNRGRMFDPGFITIIIDNNAQGQESRDNGVPKEKLNTIPITKFTKKPDTKPGEEEKCPICLVDLENHEEIRCLPCKHIFHPSCIDTWLVKNSACPICKRDVKEGLGGDQQTSGQQQQQTSGGQQSGQQQSRAPAGNQQQQQPQQGARPPLRDPQIPQGFPFAPQMQMGGFGIPAPMFFIPQYTRQRYPPPGPFGGSGPGGFFF